MAPPQPFKLENSVWIFGCGRSGSTWLAQMLESFDGWSMWPEPGFGHIFKRPVPAEPYVDSPWHVMGGAPELHQPAVRTFIEAAINTRYPHLTSTDVLVLKDQNASAGAAEISAALPECRFVALIRDPRDVLASVVDALEPASWAADSAFSIPADGRVDPIFARALFVSITSLLEFTLETYESHPGPKSLLRYENLRKDTAPVMRSLLRDLNLQPSAPTVDAVSDLYAFERIPVQETGSGKFHRRAKPGTWQETLPEEYAAAIDQTIIPPRLSEHYRVA